ncbi:hypothetical protein PG993_014398 [Apiospora rasikravindrae]|uniref:Uncharacterized protein n=1 Tax=Apiospora rasikravindrae TaxID=990691 RepID=A0ABR1RML1_9PEZI
MVLQRAASLVGLRIPRDTLMARARQLEAKLGATCSRESLEDEGDYTPDEDGEMERPVTKSTYWCPKFRYILLAVDITITHSPAPSSTPPPEMVFAQEDLPAGRRDPSTGTFLTTTMAGYELATYLRSQRYLALRVRPKFEPILAANLWESSLLKLMASLITNLCRLLPAVGIRSCPALFQESFDTLAAGGSPGSLQAGLAILEVLSTVRLQSGADGWGWRRLVVIVDELNYAEHPTTQHKVSQFVDVLRRICAKNDAPLIFTLSKPCKAIGVGR